ncbi:MAG: TolC family protein, partial [Muribaculaceae bacterium]|nr:TolC family protein [Muribaculaceae bacterium]
MIKQLLKLILMTSSFAVFGQQKMAMSLDDVIARARVNSVDAEVALGELRSAYWEYRTYRADLLPEVNFAATVPSYHKQYSTYMNDEGNYSFVRNNYLQIDGQVSIDQKIWPTGGTLSLTSQLDFLRQLDGVKYNRFMSVPVALTLNQPVFGVNTVKWDRKIEPVRYSEAKAKFLSATEEVAMKAINYYFNLLMSRENLAIAEQNHENATRLYLVAKEKRAMGQISKNDLLQMELNLLNAQSDLTECQSNLKSNMFTLRSFLDLGENVDIEPEVPSSVPNVDITFDDALNRALANNKFSKNLRRRQLEAEYQVAKAKGDMRQISLFAQIGFTGTDHELSPSYS